MATWQEMSQDCLRAAQTLLEIGCLRRSVSSAYYAAYCAFAGEFVRRGVTFAHGWNNPSHEQIPDLILHNLPLAQQKRWRLRRLILDLRRAREDADYRTGATIDTVFTRGCIRDATFILREMGVTK